MKRMLVVSCIMLSACTARDFDSRGEVGPSAAEQRQVLMTHLLDDVAIADTQVFADQTEDLAEAVQQACTDEVTAAELESLQEGWKGLAAQWANLQFSRFGPWEMNLFDTRFSQVQFWPSKDVAFIYSKIEALRTQDADVDPAGYSVRGFSERGLTPLEYLLFSVDLADYGERECQLLQGIAMDMAQTASDANEAWPAYRELILSAPNDEFDTQKDALEQQISGIWQGIELLKNDKLEKPLGAGSPAPELLETVGSAYNLAMMKANMAYMQRLVESEDGLIQFLNDNGSNQLADALVSQVNAVSAKLNAIDQDLSVVLADPAANSDDYSQYIALLDDLTVLVRLVKNDLTEALDVRVGLNTSDGD